MTEPLRAHDYADQGPSPRQILEEVAHAHLLTLAQLRAGEHSGGLLKRARRTVVQRMIAWGYSTQEIADALCVDHTTVCYHKRKVHEQKP